MHKSFGEEKEKDEIRKWDSVTLDSLVGDIEHLKHNYEPELAHKVIELFHERMRDDVPIDHDALAYLMSYVFARIMKGENSDQAFGLKPKRGEDKRTDSYDRDLHAAAIVVLYMRKGREWQQNLTAAELLEIEEPKWDYAVADAAVTLGISESTVQRACANFRDVLALLSDEALLQITGSSPPSA